jgi:hypothetical protein
MNNLAYFIGQFGPRSSRKRALSMLIKSEELSGDGWATSRDLCYRTGAFGTANRLSEEARRAYRARTFTAWRSFEQSSTSRTLATQVIPYESSRDAESAAPRLRTTWRNGPSVNVTDERRLDPKEAPELVEYPFLFEQSTARDEDEGTRRFVGGTVGPVVFLMACYEPKGSWPWGDTLSIAGTQVLTIRMAVTP